MNQMFGKRLSGLTVLVGILALLFSQASVFAHGGEDHDDQKPQTVSAGTNMIVHVARTGDFEVVIKHAPIEPDKEMVARVFVNRFATNEPVSGAKAIVTLTSNSAAPTELMATASSTPGMYEVKLPPLQKGQYKLAARIDLNGTTQTASLSALDVAPQPVTATGAIATWARTALIVLGVFVFLSIIGLLGVVMYRSSRASRREHIEGETAAA